VFRTSFIVFGCSVFEQRGCVRRRKIEDWENGRLLVVVIGWRNEVVVLSQGVQPDEVVFREAKSKQAGAALRSDATLSAATAVEVSWGSRSVLRVC